jgi:hypothetical protein
LKLDKLIKDSKLVERLDKLDPDNASGSKNDGINYWKGKKIVALAEWKKKIGRNDNAYQKDIVVQKTKEALQYFPDDHEDSLFPLKVPQELIDVTNEWINRYLELMQFRNNSKCGRRIRSGCLLCPDEKKDGNYVVGLRRLVAKAIEVGNEKEKEEDDNFDTPTTRQSLYPCLVLNRFKCPYDTKEMKKKPTHQQQVRNEEEEEEEEDSNSYDVDYLFLLKFYCSAIESALIKARKANSIVPIKNAEDIYNALTDRETLDKLLQQGLDENRLKYKEEIVEFFMSIKDNIRMEDLTFYKPIAP